MSRSTEHAWLNRFAWVTAAATLALIGIGGLVTSRGAGMAVPDWPTTFGYNMFLFPVRLWTGGVLYEHSHRLFASLVGLLTMILAAWLWWRESRRSLRWLGLAAFFVVVLQGILGGLRVTLLKDEIGIFHAALAQTFFVMVSWIALSASGKADRLIAKARTARISGVTRWLTAITTALIFGQLILGATMRHQHAGLAVPDFPLAYGKLWPPMDAASLERINQQRLSPQDYRPITAVHVGLHMVHRIAGLSILVLTAATAWLVRGEQSSRPPLARLAFGWFTLICVQALLGAATVWSDKAADVATLHVLVGAVSLLLGTILSGVALKARMTRPEAAWQGSDVAVLPLDSLSQPRPSAS